MIDLLDDWAEYRKLTRKAKVSGARSGKRPAPESVTADPSRIAVSRRPELVSLKNLLLDVSNARFGGLGEAKWEQADVLDHIVGTFGVDDVLSSLSINGYIPAEPLVCRRDKDGDPLVVVEGNRRLAACLILSQDSRASRQKNRSAIYRKIWIDHGSKKIDPLPVIIFEGSDRREALLSYLGVRHIASAQPWDSYAKAAWVAEVVEQHQLSLQDVALMIGDQHRTIRRLLEGFYFVKQTIEAGQFRPQDSQRKGRGSVTEYPFSWIYTILGYSAAREYLEIPDQDPAEDLVPTENLDRAGTVTRALFGDKSKGRSAAIEDSREIGDLAALFSDPDKVAMLNSGKSVAEITRITKPIEQRVREGLAQVGTIQGEMITSLVGELLLKEIAESLLSRANINKRTAEEIYKRISDFSIQ